MSIVNIANRLLSIVLAII